MKATPQIFDWLNQVKGDRNLPAASCFRVAFQLTQKTSTAELRKSGLLVTWQSIPTLADATGLSVRMVRYAVRDLEVAGHLAIKTGRGPGNSNHYTLVLRQPIASIDTGNSGNPLPHSERQLRQSTTPIEAISDTNWGNPLPPNNSYNNFSNNSPTTREPRSRADALGSLGTALRKRIKPDTFEAWFGKGEAGLVSQTDDTVTIETKSRFFATQILNRFEADILAITGVHRVVVVPRKAPAAKAAP